MSSRDVGIASLIAFSGFFLSTVAVAGDPTAEALFLAGRTAMEAGEYALACEKFEESQRIDPAPGTLLNIGECKAQLGRTATAWEAFSRAADQLVADDRLAYAERRRNELAAQLSYITLRVDDWLDGCTLRRDGTALGRAVLGEAIPVDPGAHEVRLDCPGRRPRSVRIDVGIRARSETRLTPGEPTPTAASGPSGFLATGAVLISLGGAALAASLGTGIATLQRKATVEEQCTPTHPPVCPPNGVEAANEGRTFSTVSTALFIGGLALVGGGVAFVLVGSSRSSGDTALVTLEIGGPSYVGLSGVF